MIHILRSNNKNYVNRLYPPVQTIRNEEEDCDDDEEEDDDDNMHQYICMCVCLCEYVCVIVFVCINQINHIKSLLLFSSLKEITVALILMNIKIKIQKHI